MHRMSKHSVILAMFACLSMSGTKASYALCSSVKSCTKTDFITAAAGEGCGLLFITSRSESCKAAGETLHSEESCGPTNNPPPRCANDQDNRAILNRLNKCLGDRATQRDSFSGGLTDIEAAKKVDYPQDQKVALKQAWADIVRKIQAGQSGHAEQIKGVENSIANCKKYLTVK